MIQNPTSRSFLAVLGLLAFCLSASAEETKPPATVPAPFAVRVENSRLTGPGAEPLLAAIREAQFVLVGEDHGFNEIPQFMGAVWNSQHFRNLVVETGPVTTMQLESFLRDSAAEQEMVSFQQRYPASVPFYNWKSEFDLLKDVMKSRVKSKQTLIGVDQEFIMSPGFLLTWILEHNPIPPVRAQAEAMLKTNNAMLAEVQKTGNMGGIYMFSAPQSAFDKLTDSARHERSFEVRRAIEQLVATQRIYAEYNSNQGYLSNRDRAQLMKRNLVQALGWDRLVTAPRLMFKFGAYHMFRGMNPINSAEIGSYISEWAEGLGLKSTHILVLAKSGTQAAFAGLNDQAHPTEFDYTKEKQLSWVARFMAAAPDGADWSVFDLRPLRPKVRDYDPAEQKTILGYDFLVVIPKATAATNVSAR